MKTEKRFVCAFCGRKRVMKFSYELFAELKFKRMISVYVCVDGCKEKAEEAIIKNIQ